MYHSSYKGDIVSEIKISTKFVTTGKRPAISVRSSDGKKGSYPSDVSTTKSHETAARKFATKIAGKGATVTKVEDGPHGDRYIVAATPAPDSETAPVATTS
jgi:hypothetical protein